MTVAKTERMDCMEVWGGNQAAARSLAAPGLKIWVDSQPFGQANGGGDVFYVSSCASGRITRIMLADVSGHGEMVSQTALELRDLMRRNVNYIKQARLVRAMNRQFSHLGELGGFATALVGTFVSATRRLSLSNAGHPVPLIYRRQKDCWSELSTAAAPTKRLANTPLGVAGEAAYAEVQTRLEAGDMLLGYSDAATESLDRQGCQLGTAGLLQLVSDADAQQPAALIPTLVSRMREIRTENLQEDDATFVLVLATGTGVSLKNNLLAPWRFFQKVVDRTNLS